MKKEDKIESLEFENFFSNMDLAMYGLPRNLEMKISLKISLEPV